ncbi:MAG: hypothetical protein WD151_03980 [Phycisphaeraceae bacterium]
MMRNHSTGSDSLLLTADTPPPDDAPRRTSPWSLLRGRLHWAVLLALLLGAGGAVGGYLFIEPVYRSSGLVRISPDVRGVLPDSDVTEPIRHYDSYIDAQVDLMRSRQVIERALQQEAWQRLGRPSTGGYMRVFRNQLEIERSRGSQVAELKFYDMDPAAAAAGAASAILAYQDIYEQQKSQQDARIQNQLYNRRDQLSRELDQLRQRRDEEAGQYGVDGLAHRYQLQLEQLTEVQQMLRRTRVQIEAMREHDTEGDDGLPSPVSLEQIAQHDETMRRMLEQQAELQDYIARGGRLGIGEQHREMRRARVQLDSLNERIEQHAARFSASDLAVQRLQAGRDPMLPSIDEMLSLPEMEARERDLERLHEDLRTEATALGRQQQQIDGLQERIEQRRAELGEIERRLDRLNLEAPLANRLEVISWGEIANVPYNQGQRMQAAIFGGGAGAMLGLGLVMLMGRFDRRVHHVEDAQGDLPAARLLGILPTLPDNFVAPEQVAITAHCVHHIRTLLQLGAKGHGTRGSGNGSTNGGDGAAMVDGQVLVVTSPSPGSGKTSLTTALGLSFAASETRTLLIDCDVVGAGLSRRLNVVVRRSLAQVLRREGMVDAESLEEARQRSETTGKPLGELLIETGRITSEDLDRARAIRRESLLGLPDVCIGEPLESCVAETGIARLSVLPVGSARPHQAGALSPAALKRVFEQARRRYDIVLVDTGPVPGSIEASMAASEADRTVLVVSRGDEKPLVLHSLEQLRSINASLAGIVFNHAPAADVQRSSYASAVSGVSGERPMPPMRVDASTSARFGPMGSAVASYAQPEGKRAGVNGHADDDESE